MQSFRRFLLNSEAICSLNRVCLTCRALQTIPRRTLFKRSPKDQRDEAKAKRKEERQKLVSEITKGYFADLREYGEKGGKRFFASDELIDHKSAVSFPVLNARNLHKRDIKLNEEFSENVTLVLMWLRAIGQNMCNKYCEPFLDQFQLHPNIKCYEINVIDGIFFKLMKPFIENSLRQQVPQEKQDRYLCYYGKTDEIKRSLIENIIVGHAFLVDGTGRIRWKAHGLPTNEEIQFLINCTQDLLKENQKNLNIQYKN